MSRRRREDDLKSVQELLWASLPPQGRRQLLVAQLARQWNRIVGPALAGKSALTALEEGKALVTAASPAVAQELNMRGASIVRTLSRYGLEVTGVQVRVGEVRRRAPKGRTQPAQRSARVDTEEVRRCREQVEERIHRDDVADSFARMMATFKKRFR